MSPVKVAEMLWAALSPTERADLVTGFVDRLRGKPPKAERIAALRGRELLALAKVAERLK